MRYPSPFLLLALGVLWFAGSGDPNLIDAVAARIARVELVEYVSMRSD